MPRSYKKKRSKSTKTKRRYKRKYPGKSGKTTKMSKIFATNNRMMDTTMLPARIQGAKWVPEKTRVKHFVFYNTDSGASPIAPGVHGSAWTDHFDHTYGALATNGYLSANDVYDPFRGGILTTSNAQGFDQLAQLYHDFTVYAVLVEFTVSVNAINDDSLGRHAIALTINQTTAAPTFPTPGQEEGAILQEGMRYKTFSSDGRNVVTRKLKYFIRIGDVLGREMDPNQDQGTSTSSPSEQYVNILPQLFYCGNYAGPSYSFGYTSHMKVTYYTEWTRPKSLAIS